MAIPLPPGIHTVNPYLVAADADTLIDFLTAALEGRVTERLVFGGQTGHAEVTVGDSVVMIGRSRDGAGTASQLYVYVDDCDAAYARALAAGAESIMAPADMYYGDRHGGVKDPAGNTWWIATKIEALSPDELQRRHEDFNHRRSGSPAA